MQPARVSTCKQLCHFCDCMCFKRIEQIFLIACHRCVYSKRGTDNLWKGSLTHWKKETEEGYREKIQKARGKEIETENQK